MKTDHLHHFANICSSPNASVMYEGLFKWLNPLLTFHQTFFKMYGNETHVATRSLMIYFFEKTSARTIIVIISEP